MFFKKQKTTAHDMLFMDGMQKHHGFVQVQAVTSPHKNQCLEQPAIR